MSAMTDTVRDRAIGRTDDEAAGLSLSRARAIVGWSVAGLVVGLAAATVVLHAHNGSTDLTSWWYGSLALTLLAPGVLITRARPQNPIGWLMLVACLSEALCAAGREYLVYGLLGGTAPGWLWLGWLADSCYLIAIIALPVLLMLFPDGRPMSRRAGYALVLPAIALAFGLFGYLFTGDVAHIRGRDLANPGAGLVPESVARVAGFIGQPALMLALLAAVVTLVLRLRRSDGEQRVQFKWIAWAGSIEAIEVITEFVPGNSLAVYTSVTTDALFVAALAVAILRHRMFDVDVVINRTLVFVALTVLVAGAYVALVVAFDALFNESTHLGPGMVATALVAVAFAPARNRLQRGVDRLMYGDRKNPYRVMTQLGRRLEIDGDSGELAVVVETVVQALKLPYAAIFDASGQPLASTGTSGVAVVEYPLSYQGSAIGHLLVSPPPGSGGFGRDQQRLLTDLARQVGAAVHAVRLSGALQASRQRLVTAKEEERLRLRRDLHDGLGPKLAALGLKLDAARGMVDTRPADARDLLGAVKGDIRETIDDIRRLVYGLRPPALDELGLAGAIRERVQSFATGAGPELVVSAPDRFPPLPAAVEVAAYWIANEAITNVVRHASARSCEVRLELAGDLLLTVRDDGDGLPDGWRAGVGTSSMAERASELGGELTMRPCVDRPGTEVHARIPVPA
ncbi:MAG TPA: sensor histidine kinase [Jatrophihabitantaceae bacterium]|nr:sensor histidine kinase [Jatrophihabitantaceae bacterium]